MTHFAPLHKVPQHVLRRTDTADAQAQRVPIGVFEVVERSARGVLSCLFIPMLVLLFTPLLRPLTLSRLLLTYDLPVLPLALFWDGLISALRAHRPDELRDMTESFAQAEYTW
ncbi:conserved uncharacterized protein [Stigmatella aurantiaca DW4/3-1]|uniref:Conserved uncharacterized protein n=1 Tax=Stigmatella aurantiaca (strain DW4/3-1) TaxID=378806 RepID=E3FEA9_STIAD|nr:conserved uncharacterized protein [Stigmatella aurantiaca DW4/3-1]